jgi:hypothetical protein
MAGEIVIQVTPQRRGFNFALDPRSEKLLESLGDANPSNDNIFVGRDNKEAFEEFSFASFENEIVTLLTGLTSEQLLEHVDVIEFQLMPSGDTEHRIAR